MVLFVDLFMKSLCLAIQRNKCHLLLFWKMKINYEAIFLSSFAFS